MNNFLKKIANEILPPIITDWLKSLRNGRIKFKGPFESWSEANTHAAGYDSSKIMRRVEMATDQVASGKACFERDGTAFHTPQFPYPLIATLLKASIENKGKLTVLDFGGSLGSSYYQCLPFLSPIKEINWHIVEQRHIVQKGIEKYQCKQLRFFETISSAIANGPINVILASGVLQYLPNAQEIFHELININADYIFIDRTPMSASGSLTITLQTVPKEINEASYPAWFFNESFFSDIAEPRYEKIATFDAIEGSLGSGELAANFKGYIYKHKLNGNGNGN